jgi:hypothetical protein
MGGSASNSAGVRSVGTDMSTNVSVPVAVVALQGNFRITTKLMDGRAALHGPKRHWNALAQPHPIAVFISALKTLPRYLPIKILMPLLTFLLRPANALKLVSSLGVGRVEV